MKNQKNNLFLLKPLVFAAALLCASSSRADQFFDLSLPGADETDVYAGVSQDGNIVAGVASFGTLTHIYRWVNGVPTDLTPGTASYSVNGMSYDGNVIVGSGNFTVLLPYRYQVDTNTMTQLNASGTDVEGIATGVSGDGLTVVGRTCGATCPVFHAAEWLPGSTTATLLPTLHPGQTMSQANAANQDGTVVVGYAQSTVSRATYWFGGTAYDLGTIGSSPGNFGVASGQANAVSADGTAVAGTSSVITGSPTHATLWNVPSPSTPTATDLGALVANGTSTGLGISGDGTVVVGAADYPANAVTNQAAFRWTQSTGMLSVVQWLANAGVSVPSTWELSSANSTNSDGSVVVGLGVNNGVFGSWLARVGGTSNPITGATLGGGIIEVGPFNNSVAEAGSRGVQAGQGLPDMALFGAHHRSILDSGLARSANGNCAWATTDASGGDNSGDTRSQITEAGVCKDIGTARLGLGIGQAWAQQDWSNGGAARYNGQYLIMEAADALENGLQPSALAYYGKFNTSMSRHYANGAAIDSSNASPDANSYALRLRLDWKNVARLGQFDISPYAAYTWLKTKLDAYTETGGGFPAQFSASSAQTNDFRLGAAAATALSSSTDLRLGLEAVHRSDGSSDGVNGQVIGLWSFSLPGQNTNQTWARTTVDIDHRLGKSALITVGANLASAGGDAPWGITAGIRASF
jgi:hypothetical protein